jgi:PPOX class probable F420-dependent enzyme
MNDPILGLRGLGNAAWENEDPDRYVARLRGSWDMAMEERVELNELAQKFLEENHALIMVTVRADGTAHAARANCALVEGKLWSSGTKGRVRTKHLRANPNATFCVFARDRRWIGIEGIVTIHESPDAPQQTLALHRAQGREPDDVNKFLKDMVAQERIIYELEPKRVYGSYEEAPHG